MGTLPWRVEEFHGNLRRAFEAYGRRGPFGQFDIVFYAASLAHYVSDAHVPFHAVVNYDGQLTGQNGIHSRFESALFERYRDQLTIAPKPIAPILQPARLHVRHDRRGHAAGAPILKADLEAIGNRDVYDDAYYKAFFAANRPVLERRLNEAIAGRCRDDRRRLGSGRQAAGPNGSPADPATPPPVATPEHQARAPALRPVSAALGSAGV